MNISSAYYHMIDAAWLLQLVLLAMTWAIFSVKKLNVKSTILYTVCLAMILWLCHFLLFLIANGSMFPILWSFVHGVISFGFVWVFAQVKPQNKILMWGAVFNVVLSISALSGECSLLISRATENGIINGGIRSCLYFVMPLCALFLRELNFDDFPTIPGSCLLLVGILLFCEYALSIGEALFFDSSTTTCIIFAIAYCSMLLYGIVSVHALYTICSEQQTVYQLTAEKQRFLSEREISAIAETSLEDLRCIRHDLKNHYGYLQILLEQQRYPELEEYLRSMQENLPPQLTFIDCGNRVVNTVLNMEYSKLRIRNITFEHHLVVPPVLPFRDEDVCSLLANLLDNAREECCRLQDLGQENLRVQLDIHPHQSYLLVRCLNTTNRTTLRREGFALSTTKSEKEFHGFGTRIIVKLAEKYNGCAEFALEDGMFSAQAMLDMTKGDLK